MNDSKLQTDKVQPKEKAGDMYDPGPGYRPEGEKEAMGSPGEMTMAYPSSKRIKRATRGGGKVGGSGGIDGSHF